jgi:alpha-mannosidase
MPLTELNVLLSCHSLDDFPTYHTGKVADGILAACTALWHPALIAAVGKMPSWLRADDPPEQLAGRLIAVPQVVQDDMPGFFFSQAEEDGAKLITGLHDREKIVAAALDALQASREPERPENETTIDESLVADFLALGFCYLQTEVLTRRMRYMSNLDEDLFERTSVAAAKAAAEGNVEEARTQLTAAFNALLESRGYYYPVDAYFLDITLVAPTTIGAALQDELNSGAPINLLLSAATLERMAAEEPTTLAILRTGLVTGAVGLIGGELNEVELPLLSHELILAQLKLAGEVYDRLLGQRPAVFGRWRAGLTPVLPQILHECGFIGAMHFTLDGAGRFPQSDRIKTAWSGLDGTTINAITKPPFDAARPETFLALSETLGDTMDHDFVATAEFAHWPGRASPFYDDLRRAAKYAAVLGKFATASDYFNETESSGTNFKFPPDQYRSPYLQQSVASGGSEAISSPAELCRRHAQQQAAETLTTMACVLQGSPPETALHDAAEAFATVWHRQAKSARAEVQEVATPQDSEQGYLFINPLNFTRRIGVELPQLSLLPAVTGQVLAADDAAGITHAVVEVPPLGFAWITANSSNDVAVKPRKGKPQTIVVEDNRLRNEFCEVKIHPHTGGIQSIHDFRTRGNRLSQQLAMRLPSVSSNWREASEPTYSIMAADSIEVEQNDATLGRIASQGRLVHPSGKVLAQFMQTVSLWYGARTIELEIELLSVSAELSADPWNSYVAARFAWSSSTVELRRSVHECSVATEARRFEAPLFVEIIDGSARTGILTGGLPYHRRSGDRMLDTLLKVRGESATRFRLGIGINAPHVWRAAQEMLVPPTVVFEKAVETPSASSGWLFHIDAPNVMATHWSPLEEAGRVAGFRVRLLETEARRGPVRVRCFRPATSAKRVDLAGNLRGELTIVGDSIVCEVGPYEWIQIEARW